MQGIGHRDETHRRLGPMEGMISLSRQTFKIDMKSAIGLNFHLIRNEDVPVPPPVSSNPQVGGNPHLQPVHVFTDDLVGQYCVVRYQGKPYPALIEDVDDDSIRVDAMSRIGRRTNEFFWPDRKDNEVWYEDSDIVTLIPEPQLLEGSDRHYRVDSLIWDEIVKQLDEWVR